MVSYRAPTSRIPSHFASAEAVRRRSVKLTEVSLELSGGTVEAARVQDLAGLNRRSQSEQDKLLKDAGLQATTPAAGSLLAIKADLQLSWNKLRNLKRWMKSFGIELESERTARPFIARSIPTYVAKTLPMAKRNGDISMTSYVYFPNLVDIVINYLNKYDVCNKLT